MSYIAGPAVKIMKPPHWWLRMHYELTEPLSLFGFTVPAGFFSDGATTPRWSWALFPPLDRYAEAAFLHDYLLVKKPVPRHEADHFFRRALLDLGVKPWRAWVMYYAVRIHSLRVQYLWPRSKT